jgi:hypothetical protein
MFKVYKNPHTGEVVETKGGNQKTLKEWKAEHGSDTVESWLTKGVWFEYKRAREGPFNLLTTSAMPAPNFQ